MNTNENIDRERKARNKIFMVLSDGKPHRIKELKTVVSSRTLYGEKFLKTFEGFIERREDKESGEYPYPVYYRANPTLMSVFTQSNKIGLAWKKIEKQFLETKNFVSALEQINEETNRYMLIALSNFKRQNIDVTDPKIVRLFLDAFVWQGYEILTWRLIVRSMKFINDIDLEKNMKDM